MPDDTEKLYEDYRDELLDSLTPRQAELFITIVEMGEDQRQDLLAELWALVAAAKGPTE